MSKLCKLGDRACYLDGKCHYTGSCVNQVEAEVEDKTQRAVEGKWKYDEGCECWVCSECDAAALNDYAGRSTPSTFCPNCGKLMILSIDVGRGDISG